MATKNLSISSIISGYPGMSSWEDDQLKWVIAGNCNVYINGSAVQKNCRTKVTFKLDSTSKCNYLKFYVPLNSTSCPGNVKAYLSTVNIDVPGNVLDDSGTSPHPDNLAPYVIAESDAYSDSGCTNKHVAGTWTSTLSPSTPPVYFKFTINKSLAAGTYYVYIARKSTEKRPAIYGSRTISDYTMTMDYPNTYVVKYDANGGTTKIPNQVKTQGEGLKLTTTKPLYSSTFENAVTYNVDGEEHVVYCINTTSRQFIAWNTLPDGTGKSYSSGATYSEDKDVTLFAQYGESTTYYETTTLEDPGSKLGYKFSGWYTKEVGGSKVGDAGDSFTPEKSTTVYARWTPYQLRVTYSANGGHFANDEYTDDKIDDLYFELGNYGGTEFTPMDAFELGCELVGYHIPPQKQWYYDIGSGVGYFTPSGESMSVVDFASQLGIDLTSSDAEVTLYANWEINKGVIYFHTNGGNAVTSKYDHSITDLGVSSFTQEFTYENSTLVVPEVLDLFSKSYSYIRYDATAWIIGEPQYSQDGKLEYPQWAPNGEEVSPLSWELYDNFISQHLTQKDTVSPDEAPQPIDFKRFVQDDSCEIHLYPNWVPTYLEVLYLLTDTQGNISDSKTSQYLWNEQASIDSVSSVWENLVEELSIGYHCQYDRWVETVSGNEVSLLSSIASELAEELNTLGVAVGDLSNSPQSISLAIKWERNSYTITYDSRGGSLVGNTIALYNTPTELTSEVPTKDDYVFNGWAHTDPNLTKVYQSGGSIVVTYPKEQEVPLYAVWVAEGTPPEVEGGTCYIKIAGAWKPASMMTKINGIYR